MGKHPYLGCFESNLRALFLPGGGKRCQEPGCTKSAQGKTGRCKGHGESIGPLKPTEFCTVGDDLSLRLYEQAGS